MNSEAVNVVDEANIPAEKYSPSVSKNGLIGGVLGCMIAVAMGFESNDEYNEIMFLREITHTVNALNDMADIVRLYSKKPETAEQRLANLLSEVMYEDSESV